MHAKLMPQRLGRPSYSKLYGICQANRTGSYPNNPSSKHMVSLRSGWNRPAGSCAREQHGSAKDQWQRVSNNLWDWSDVLRIYRSAPYPQTTLWIKWPQHRIRN